MFKKLKTLIIMAAAALMLTMPLALATASAAGTDISGNLCGGAQLKTSASTGCNADTGTFNHVLSTIVNVFSLVVGIVAVIMIIIGGFNYITSGGD